MSIILALHSYSVTGDDVVIFIAQVNVEFFFHSALMASTFSDANASKQPKNMLSLDSSCLF